MSIVIAAIDNNRELCIAADNRRIVDGVVSDDYHKLLQLTPQLYYGMTGVAEEGLAILKELLDIQFSDPNAMIEHLDKIFTPRKNQLTITLAGKWNSGKYFLWNKNNSGEVSEHTPHPSQLVYSISSSGVADVRPFFRACK